MNRFFEHHLHVKLVLFLWNYILCYHLLTIIMLLQLILITIFRDIPTFFVHDSNYSLTVSDKSVTSLLWQKFLYFWKLFFGIFIANSLPYNYSFIFDSLPSQHCFVNTCCKPSVLVGSGSVYKLTSKGNHLMSS